MRTRVLLALLGLSVSSCRGRADATASNPSNTALLADSVSAIFDSLVAVHQATPDTALLARLFPPSDTLVYVEGGHIALLTGDSLLRRTVNAHRGVRSIDPRATERHVRLLSRDAAEITAQWVVDVVDTAGRHHPWRGPITIAVQRRNGGWIVRSYRE